MQEVYSVLSDVDNKRAEINTALVNAQNAIADIADKFEDLSVSTVEDIDDKIKEIDTLKQEVKETERISFFNLNMQAALINPANSAKLKAFDELNTLICLDTVLPVEKKNKLWAELHFHIAGIVSLQGKFDMAIEHYNKAIALDPAPAMYNNRGKEYKNRGNIEKAIEDYNRAIELCPDYAEAYNNRGDYYAFLEDYGAAIENYNKAVELNPDYTAAYYNRGRIYAKKGEHENAVSDYNKALKNDPNFVKLYYKRGVSYKALNLIEEALDDLERCIELDPKNLTGYKNDAQAEINHIKEVEEE
jgi:tetratricopeptide (TPR) repeat protein